MPERAHLPLLLCFILACSGSEADQARHKADSLRLPPTVEPAASTARRFPVELSASCRRDSCDLAQLPQIEYRFVAGDSSLAAYWGATLTYIASNGDTAQAGIAGAKPFKLKGPTGRLPLDEELSPRTGLTAGLMISNIPALRNVRGQYEVLIVTLYTSEAAATGHDSLAWLALPLRFSISGRR